MKRSISYFLFFSCLIFVTTPLFAATQTLSTYYPAPQGNYKNMTVSNGITMASQASSVACSGGSVTLTDVGGVLQVCDASGARAANFWTSNANYIYPTGANGSTLDLAVGTGASSAAGGNALFVGGASVLGGNTSIIGTLNVSSTAYVGGLATFNTDIDVTGLSTLNGDALFNHNATVTGAATVSGATSLAATTISGTATIAGAAALNGGATASSLIVNNGTVTLCSSPGVNCGTLAVAYSGGKYYAAYGP